VLKSIKYSQENKVNKSWLFLCIAALVHLSLVFFILIKLIGNLVKHKILFVLIITILFLLFQYVSSQENILFLIDFLSEIGEEWSFKLSKYLYDILELADVKALPLQIYYVGFSYLLYLYLNFKKDIDIINELMLISFILIIPVLMIPSDTITSRLIELCFYFLPLIQFTIYKDIHRQKYVRLSLTMLIIFIIINIKMFTKQLL
jgi:hypothetical protein